MTAAVTAQSIAEELRQAYEEGPRAAAQVLAGRMADEVELRHEPPSPSDGLVPSAVLDGHRLRELDAFTTVMPDFCESATVSAQGDLVEVEISWSGTLPDGQSFALTIPATYTVRDGQIVRMVGKVDPVAADALRVALEAAGLDLTIPQPQA